MSPEEVSAASGKRATFILHVLTRQNATWQGHSGLALRRRA